MICTFIIGFYQGHLLIYYTRIFSPVFNPSWYSSGYLKVIYIESWLICLTVEITEFTVFYIPFKNTGFIIIKLK